MNLYRTHTKLRQKLTRVRILKQKVLISPLSTTGARSRYGTFSGTGGKGWDLGKNKVLYVDFNPSIK